METFRNITVYDLGTYVLITGTTKQKAMYKILKVTKENNSLEIKEDMPPLSASDLASYLHQVIPEERATPVAQAHAILGLIRFLQGFYLFLVTKKQKVAKIREQTVFKIQDTKLIKLFTEPSSKNEKRYKDLFNSLEISLGFFYSHTYDLTRTLQENITQHTVYRRKPQSHYSSFDDRGIHSHKWKGMYVWNREHLNTFLSVLKEKRWATPIVHGYVGYRQLRMLGQLYDLVLIARRSRHFAGTRYLKRGLNEQGKVANDVETEQMIIDKGLFGEMSSFVQVRGSIPLFWCQEPNPMIPPPAIILNQNDFLRDGTRRHVADLYRRYGVPAVMLNLLKRDLNSREALITNEFQTCVEFLNARLPLNYHIDYTNFDIKAIAKESESNCIDSLARFAAEKIKKTGIFSLKVRRSHLKLQHQIGVIRTNCIDCIDRTNAAQTLIARRALEEQLVRMRVVSHLEPNSDIVRLHSELYEEMGDIIALQYSGSEAHKQFSKANIHRANSFVTSIKRHWANLITDNKKQQAINLFLGVFKPNQHHIHLWDIEDDSRLHNRARPIFETFPRWWSVECSKFTGALNLPEILDSPYTLQRSKTCSSTHTSSEALVVIPLLTEAHSSRLSSMSDFLAESISHVTEIRFSNREMEPLSASAVKREVVADSQEQATPFTISPDELQILEDYIKSSAHTVDDVILPQPEVQEEELEPTSPEEVDIDSYLDLAFDESLLQPLSLPEIVKLINF